MMRAEAPKRSVLFLVALAVLSGLAGAENWPTYRYNAGRTAASPEELPKELHLQWVRTYLPFERAWLDARPNTFTFDRSYHPVVTGDLLFLGSPRSDWVSAFEVKTGRERWRFYTDGPVRFAPVAMNGKVYAVSDDGYLYCLRAEDGKLLWRVAGAPHVGRRILGNKRLISTWPARGGPVICDGIVYFAAGIWPFMGTFVHAVDAETGRTFWCNSSSGCLPNAERGRKDFVGTAPQGYLAVNGNALLVPNGMGYPACFNRKTGTLIKCIHSGKFAGDTVQSVGPYYFSSGHLYDVGSARHLGSGIPRRIVATACVVYSRKGAFDLKGVQQSKGRWGPVVTLPTLWRMPVPLKAVHLKAGGRLYGSNGNRVVAIDLPVGGGKPAVSWQGRVDGAVSEMLAANGRLFVVTRAGKLYCFGGNRTTPKRHKRAIAAIKKSSTPAAETILEVSGVSEGYCIVLGAGETGVVEGLIHDSKLHVIAVEPDAKKVDALRRRLDAAGVYGVRAAAHTGDVFSFGFPPYLANLVVVNDPERAGFDRGRAFVEKIFRVLRPYGGTACLALSLAGHQKLAAWVKHTNLPGAKLTRTGKFSLLVRRGPLSGSGSWTHQFADAANTGISRDRRVRAPLGILWFGGSSNAKILPRHGHGPSPQVAGGRLFIQGPNIMRAVDVYTGRILWESELPGVGKRFKTTGHQPGARDLGGNYVSLSDGVYVVYGRKCLRLDPATGRTVKEFSLPKEPGSTTESGWGYVGVSGDVLLGGALLSDIGIGRHWVGAFSKRLVAMDRHTGKVLWTIEARQAFRHTAIAVTANRVFCVDRFPDILLRVLRSSGRSPEPARLLALDLVTGKIAWSTRDAVFGARLSYSKEYDALVESRPNPLRDSLRDAASGGIRVFRGAGGKVLWARFKCYYGGPVMLHGRTIITQYPGAGLDLLTGKIRMRTNPLTGRKSPWGWNRAHRGACSAAIGSQNLLLFRSKSAGYFDLLRDGGAGSLSGFRSGCSENLIAADGVLCAPDYTRTCVCNYQNQTSLAFIYDPEAEMWTSNNYRCTGHVKRIGINFGAPGDRMAENGTLWLDWPSVGYASPDLPVKVAPKGVVYFRGHATEISGEGHKWVAASGVKGLTKVSVDLGGGGNYTVRLYFSEPEERKPGERIFTVALQGRPVLRNFDITKEAGRSKRLVIREFRGVRVDRRLDIQFTPAANSAGAVLCGVEAILDAE